MTASLSSLAYFGGEPLFADRVRPLGQLTPPDLDRVLALLDEGGDLAGRLEADLGRLHDVEHVVLCTNACVGIVALIELLGRCEAGEVIIPSFSYAGLPHLVQWSGHRPRWCDARPHDHAMDPERVADAIHDETALVLAVHQFNTPSCVDELTALCAERDVPLVFDAVHGLYCTHRGEPIGRFGAAEVFSTHATKSLNGFEGGYVTTRDPRLATRLRTLLSGESVGAAPGLPGGMSDLHVAFAHASLERIDEQVARNRARYEAYAEGLEGLDGVRLFPYADPTERYNHTFAIVEVLPELGISRDELGALMLAEGARTLPYYGAPTHASEKHRPPEIPRPSLPVTEDLSTRFLQLPVGDHTSLLDGAAVCSRLSDIHALRHEVRSALDAGGRA
jgi:dTDP-4-amino-4,6-dideoxygalactose transaminase